MSELLKISIDVTKIKKEHLIKGKKGTYANLDIWLNDEPDQYQNDAGVKQSCKLDNGTYESHFIGNGRWVKQKKESKPAQENKKEQDDLGGEDLPFR